MAPLLPTQAVFVEERYLASIFYARLRSICAAKAAIAHVEVAQTFQAYIAHGSPGDVQAQGDVETVLQLLNDDGEGRGALHNTAVGYRFSQAARVFQAMAHLPADRLAVPATAPVAMAARFNEVFVEAQLNLEERPQRTGNAVLDMIRDLIHLRLVIAGIMTCVDHALEANAQIIYAPTTKAQYDRLRAQLAELWAEALSKLGRAARIIEQYAPPAHAPARQEERAQVPARTPLVLVATTVDDVRTAVQATPAGASEDICKSFNAKTPQGVAAGTREGQAPEALSPTSAVEASHPCADIGQDEPMPDLKQLAGVAASDIPVLLIGESSTGNECIAYALHQQSPRAHKPFVVVHCGAIPAPRIDSELFGSERGALPGAVERRIGKCELAQGGTLFVDGIDKLRWEIQTKLLRILQERALERVGGKQPNTIDVRLVAATNAAVRGLVAMQAFRDDLYDGFVVSISVPPLRVRKGDIPLLVQHFVEKYAREFNRPVRGVSPAAMEVLQAYEWPGDGRALENVVEQLVVLSQHTIIQRDELPFYLHREPKDRRMGRFYH